MPADGVFMTQTYTEGWRLEAHCCAGCRGRLVSKSTPNLDGIDSTTRLYRCAECGIEREGHSPAIICACGFKVKGRTNLGLRCEPNPGKSPFSSVQGLFGLLKQSYWESYCLFL
jgi:DNA-directed RNA polymerase subunit RPC12/RpoP